MSGNQSQTKHDRATEPVWTRWGLIDMVLPLLCCISIVVGCCALLVVDLDDYWLDLPSSAHTGLLIVPFSGLFGLALCWEFGNRLTLTQLLSIGAIAATSGIVFLVMSPYMKPIWYHHLCTREQPAKHWMDRLRACEVTAWSAQNGEYDASPCSLRLHSCTMSLGDHKHHTHSPWLLVSACKPLLKHGCEAEIAKVCTNEEAYTSACEQASVQWKDGKEHCTYFKEELCSAPNAGTLQ